MVPISYAALGWVVGLVTVAMPGDPSTSPAPVYPTQSSGFAANVVGGFFALGLLVLVWVLLHLKPKRREPYRGPND